MSKFPETKLVTCPYCGKEVPRTDYCVECGYTLTEGLVRDKQSQILLVIKRLGGKKVSFPQIYNRIGGKKESLRSLIAKLKSRGYLEHVGRGVYSLTNKVKEE